MKEIFDYTISDEKEKIPIGYVKSLYNDEIIEHYSEQSMLKDYKNIVNNEGVNSARYKIYKTDIKLTQKSIPAVSSKDIPHLLTRHY